MEKNFKKRRLAKFATFLKVLFIIAVVEAFYFALDWFILKEYYIALGLSAFMLVVVYIPMLFSELKRVKRSFCKYCGAKYNYNRDIAWEVSSEEEKTNSLVAYVDVECTCQNCGAEVDFTLKQTTASVDPKTGRVKQYNLRNSMRKYFYKPNK